MIKNYLIMAALVAAFFMGNRWASLGYQLEISEIKNQALSSENAQLVSFRAKEQRLQAITDKYNQLLAKPKIIYKTITKEVTHYVQDTNINKCKLNSRWVRLHNASATGSLPETTRSPDKTNAAYPAVTDDKALMVITHNYEVCNEYKMQLETWQNWWSEIKHAH